MADKRTIIIEKAIKLFAAKGYHSTSIQEIAKACGIAKGTLYNYFESKEDVMLSVLKYYSKMILNEIENIAKDQRLTAKEVFMEQIHFQFKECVKHRDFIEMHIREYAVNVNEEINNLLFEIRSNRLRWLTNCLRNVYGENIEPFVLDLATIMNGLMREYLEYIILDKKDFDILELSKFIINRMDDLANSLINSGEHFLEFTDLEEFMKDSHNTQERLKCKVFKLIKNVLDQVQDANLTPEIINKVRTTMEIVEDELINKEEPKILVVEGLLLFLRTLHLSDFVQYWDKLEEILHEYSETQTVT